MRTVYSDRHHLHHGHAELHDGQMVPCFEMPRRAEMILQRVRAVGLGEVIPPVTFGLGPIRRVHTPGYVEFLATAWRGSAEVQAIRGGCTLGARVSMLYFPVDAEHGNLNAQINYSAVSGTCTARAPARSMAGS